MGTPVAGIIAHPARVFPPGYVAVVPDVLPPDTRAWLTEAGEAGVRHALAEAFGDADARWRHTGLPLFDPAYRHGPRLSALPDPGVLLAVTRRDRARTGAYYTPPALADRVTAAAWDGQGDVLDPACGAGAFLLAALRAVPARRRATLAAEALRGTDLDADAVLVSQAAVAVAAGLDRRGAAALVAHVHVGDALASPPAPARTVLTNPPFLNRLRSLTALDPALATEVGRRHPDTLGPYTDVSTVFLLDAVTRAERVGIVLPASICAARDASGARLQAGAPAWAWPVPAGDFRGVAVPLVAVAFGSGRPLPLPAPGDWTGLLLDGTLPAWQPAADARTLGELAHVEADFRDEYYALRGHVREGADGVRVVTSGAVGLGVSHWGEQAALIHKQRWLRPTVPREALHRRQAARRGPRVYVATQTRLLEACAESDDSVGLTPVLTVLSERLSPAALLAVLLSPPASVWARRVSIGTARTLSAIKLSATQLRALPLPASIPDDAVRLAERVAARDASALPALAARMTEAYGAPSDVLAWWTSQRNR